MRFAYPGAALPAVDAVTLAVAAGETLAVLGPSGCGKSTVLRLAAGLERPASGRVTLGGQDAAGLPPERRGVGLVFQDYALFPHRTVEGNVAYGLEERRLPRETIRARVAMALERVGLASLGDRPVAALSGGERQRVALARALAPEPGVLLLDEPLANLDERLRAGLREELRELFEGLGAAVVLVTHDVREALALADRVGLMRAGRVVAEGTPRELYASPPDAWSARFLGHANLLEAADAGRIGLSVPPGRLALVPEAAVSVGLDAAGAAKATVVRAIYEGRWSRVCVQLNGIELEAATELEVRAGETVLVAVDPRLVRDLESSPVALGRPSPPAPLPKGEGSRAGSR